MLYTIFRTLQAVLKYTVPFVVSTSMAMASGNHSNSQGEKFSCYLTSYAGEGVLAVKVSSQCSFNSAAKHILVNECKKKRFSVVNISNKTEEHTYGVNDKGCALFNASSDKLEDTGQHTSPITQKYFVLQFYSGNASPNLSKLGVDKNIVEIVKRDFTYFVFSKKRFTSYPQAKAYHKSLTSALGSINAWIKSVP